MLSKLELQINISQDIYHGIWYILNPSVLEITHDNTYYNTNISPSVSILLIREIRDKIYDLIYIGDFLSIKV